MPFETDASQHVLCRRSGRGSDRRGSDRPPGLKVIGRSAARQFRGRAPRDVARELGAAVVLTGSVRPAGDTVKISLELIDPSDDTAIWSQQYTRELKDIFAVQAQVAGDVAQALRVKLQPTPSSARAASRLVDPRAYELYLRGRQAAAERHLPEAIGVVRAGDRRRRRTRRSLRWNRRGPRISRWRSPAAPTRPRAAARLRTCGAARLRARSRSATGQRRDGVDQRRARRRA